MQNYTSSTGPPQGPKNYVFVDEHNRHKRLKVMRACEGCRRRKIKCDSATTNSWPCAACTRLKLQCVPPVGGVEGDAVTGSSFVVADGNIEGQAYVPSAQQNQLNQNAYESSFQSNPGDQLGAYESYPATFSKPQYGQLQDPYGAIYAGQTSMVTDTANPYQVHSQAFISSQTEPGIRLETTDASPSMEHYTAEDLSQHLGDLKIGERGVAPYLRQPSDSKEPAAPDAEPEVKILNYSTGAGSQIRIPPALMPDTNDAMKAFTIFFQNVHPYLPVLSRAQFYDQWNKDRNSISPLLLEAIFACAGRMSDDPAGGAQWLALANKHEVCFLDNPRISTLQALLLLLKARENAPKKGYYYRSWMTCKTIVSMAKDLDLNEHHEIHNSGEKCELDPVDCLLQTRIWQATMVCEIMVGGPQGRSDLGVDPFSVNINPNPPNYDIDEYEKSISRQYAYFVRNARNIRLITEVSLKMKRKKDEELAQQLLKYNDSFKKWPEELPVDLRLSFPPNGDAPSLPSHFVGNMHTHYHLAIVMLRRPQLSASQSFAKDQVWRQHMTVCYSSAKIICRLQEAVLERFELTGLDCMIRGISFSIYSVLTCIMIHLIAITHPDPEFNTDAREYFVRHMRVLERCMHAWPMAETQEQINGLRAAFSANLSRPFELKSSFPLGSPPEQRQTTPGSQTTEQPHLQIQNEQRFIPAHMNQTSSSYLATPPISAVSGDSKSHSPQYQGSFAMDPTGYSTMTSGYYHSPGSDVQWNPTPIIDQFNTAFAIPAAALAPPSRYGNSPPGNLAVAGTYNTATESPPYNAANYTPPHPQYYTPQQQHQQPQQAYFDASAQMTSSQPSMQSSAIYPSNTAVYVTPKEWQQSVASVFDPGGLKRRWDYSH